MDRNFTLRFKNKSAQDQNNLCITSFCKNFDGHFVVDIWDVTRDYHSLKPYEDELKVLDENIKSTDDKDIKDRLKSTLSFWRKYGNKLIKVDVNEFDETFEITKCTYPNRLPWCESITPFDRGNSIKCVYIDQK